MGVMTSLTRMWLTRSTKPFVFTKEFDEILPFQECAGLGLYVHIPFCKTICNFCPYCKEVYSKETCDRYIDALIKEIHMIGRQGKGKKTVTSLYFGGGTPALIAGRLKEIIDALCQYFTITEGVGVELHPDNVTVPLLKTLRNAQVTKISIGIQSFQKKYQTLLGRKAVEISAMSKALNEVAFDTVSMDFI